jgi:hypothetical protein
MDPQSRQNGQEPDFAPSKMHRRKFLLFTGTAASAALVGVSACRKKNDDPTPDSGVNLGSGDTGVLNYAYALEQLEAAFYTQVMASPYSGMSALEAEYLADIRDHEIAHREFFKAALGSNAIQGLEVNFSSINFSSRSSVLATAKAFEDLGVSAYNGAGKLLTDVNNLVFAGKIVSVEARHAAIIRELITRNTFVTDDVVNPNTGLDLARTPNEVLSIASAYLKTKINASNLPTS